MMFCLRGLILGFSIAAPARPIAVLSIRHNRVSGAIIAGFGALALLAVR